MRGFLSVGLHLNRRGNEFYTTKPSCRKAGKIDIEHTALHTRSSCVVAIRERLPRIQIACAAGEISRVAAAKKRRVAPAIAAIESHLTLLFVGGKHPWAPSLDAYLGQQHTL